MKTKKIIRNVIFVLALGGAAILLIVAKDLPSIWAELANIDIAFLLLAVLVGLMYFVTWGYSLQILVRHKSHEISKKDNFLIGGMDFFFNGITPFSTGGQPIQLYEYSRCGVDNSDATSALMMNFIVHQVVTNILSLIALVLYHQRVMNAVEGFMIVVFIGFSINVFVLAFLMIVALSPKALTGINHFLNFLCRFKLFNKLLANKREAFDAYIKRFQKTFIEMLKDWFLLTKVIIVRTVSLIILYSIPYFVLIALGADVGLSDLCFIIAISAFTFTFTIFIPTPGASGGAEFSFKTLLLAIPAVALVPSYALSTMLIWRFITYYLALIYGFILYIIFEKGASK